MIVFDSHGSSVLEMIFIELAQKTKLKVDFATFGSVLAKISQKLYQERQIGTFESLVLFLKEFLFLAPSHEPLLSELTLMEPDRP